ncbi:OmpH family outer membrane protein [Algoriphagus halophilus]|uniref:Periplasmic chaperone for outer membrane proteins Skp n=1 Tax=Algoriphagus halophilus TaxID=226505 RepID=A0A1N6E0W2_9BACT|nr:OmpH family outer membrane protein [Algoriphagus halophilus]SIN76659.1 periplasmic chaperone for outer membrane proteins Skp [Algoriphagus halophilus]
MKKGLKLFGILGLATVLFYGCNQPAATSSEGSTPETTTASGDLKVAFVYTDSVINKYEYFVKKSEEITEKGKKFEGELQSRAQGFEREVANFQQSANSMTQNQALAKQDELGKKQQNLMTYRDNLMQELSVDEANLYNEVYTQVQEYLDNYAKENSLDVILSYTRGGAVWYASDAMDVTKAVIDGLNKKYNSTSTDSAK